MCNEAMRENPAVFFLAPDCFKTQEMCEKAVKDGPWHLKHVPDHLKMQGMCNKAVDRHLYLLQNVPDWFVTQQVKPWYNDKLIEWYNDCKKQKAQKVQIKKELMWVAWYPSRWCDWCVPEAEKREAEKLWA